MMWLALCGALEAVVYQFRYRSAVVGRPIAAAGWAGLLAVLRVIWTVLGVSAWMSGGPVWRVCLVYAAPVAVATFAAHWWSDRQLRKLRPVDLSGAIAPKRVVELLTRSTKRWATDNPNPAPSGPPPVSQVKPASSSRIGPSHTEVRP